MVQTKNKNFLNIKSVNERLGNVNHLYLFTYQYNRNLQEALTTLKAHRIWNTSQTIVVGFYPYSLLNCLNFFGILNANRSYFFNKEDTGRP